VHKTLGKILKMQRSHLFWISYGLLILSTAVFGLLGGLLFGYAIDLPEVSQLQEVRPNIVSYVYSDNGQLLGQFAVEKRILVAYEQVPELLRKAIVAAEDADFFEHPGIDFQRLFVTVVRDIAYGERKGASTLTMQLSKLLFTGSEKTIERKIKDMLFALEIEKTFSKEQIFTFYCNQIYMGHGTYGIASAADFYFNKSLPELTLAESALLAGIIQVPGRHSPINYPEQSMRRRNVILQRMYDEDLITTRELRKALLEPILVRGKNYEQSPAPYFVEWVRQGLEENYSTDQIWEGGLKIHTTLNHDIQVAARRTLREGLKRFDKETVEWTGPVANILQEQRDLESYRHPEWQKIFYEGQLVHGLVLDSSPSGATVRLGSYTAEIGPEDIAWTEEERVDQILKTGDLCVFSISEINQSDKTLHATLDRIPEVQGALIAIENRTGAIRAMVGGFDFAYSEFNRATQALRQPGSLFKPFTYVAAIESGYSPSEQILDAPVSFRDGLGRLYAPENSDQVYKGLISIRDAFALSRNVPTIRLANALGIENVIKVARRFGLQRELPPYLPVALGAAELTLQEITSAFSVFPNNGVRAEPFFLQRVEDYNGVSLQDHRKHFETVISPDVAEQMVYMFRTVVENGTARRARVLERPLGGKTGTTNDSTDSWFVGFTPQITVGVWAGHDEKISLGKRVYGATLALPIWVEFMQKVADELPIQTFADHYTLAQPAVTQPEGSQDTETEPGPQRHEASPWSVEDIPPPAQSGL